MILAKTTPFVVGVHFDSYERCAGNPDTKANCEYITTPSGGIGFKLEYFQKSC